jgi:hypothetical protein
LTTTKTVDCSNGASAIQCSYAALETCTAGFVDLGHLRDFADLTIGYSRWLSRHHRAKDHFNTLVYQGFVDILKEIPAERMIDLAPSIAFDQSIYYEIETYWSNVAGNHHSAFAPEDLVSNFLDLKQKYGEWVLDVLEYDSVGNLLNVFDKAVVRPALQKAEELLVKKLEAVRARHVRDYILDLDSMSRLNTGSNRRAVLHGPAWSSLVSGIGKRECSAHQCPCCVGTFHMDVIRATRRSGHVLADQFVENIVIKPDAVASARALNVFEEIDRGIAGVTYGPIPDSPNDFLELLFSSRRDCPRPEAPLSLLRSS